MLETSKSGYEAFERVGMMNAYLPMYDSLKSTLSWIFSMAGTTRSCRQALASGHLDMMWASRGTFFVVALLLWRQGVWVLDDRLEREDQRSLLMSVGLCLVRKLWTVIQATRVRHAAVKRRWRVRSR